MLPGKALTVFYVEHPDGAIEIYCDLDGQAVHSRTAINADPLSLDYRCRWPTGLMLRKYHITKAVTSAEWDVWGWNAAPLVLSKSHKTLDLGPAEFDARG